MHSRPTMTQKLNTDNDTQGQTALRITLYMGWMAASGMAKIAAMREPFQRS